MSESKTDQSETEGRLLYTCTTPGCEVVGHFTDEPIHCSICLNDLSVVYDTTGDLRVE